MRHTARLDIVQLVLHLLGQRGEVAKELLLRQKLLRVGPARPKHLYGRDVGE